MLDVTVPLETFKGSKSDYYLVKIYREKNRNRREGEVGRDKKVRKEEKKARTQRKGKQRATLLVAS